MAGEDINSKTVKQHEDIRQKYFKKLVATARNIISNETSLPVGAWKIGRLISWLKQEGISVDLPVFDEYQRAISAIPWGKERLNCSRDALRRYDSQLIPITTSFNDPLIDACFEIIETYEKSN